MSTTDDLIPLLKKLRLSGVLQSLELRTRQAVEDDLAHSEFLLRLLSDEVERRDSKQLEARLRRAAFDSPRALEEAYIIRNALELESVRRAAVVMNREPDSVIR